MSSRCNGYAKSSAFCAPKRNYALCWPHDICQVWSTVLGGVSTTMWLRFFQFRKSVVHYFSISGLPFPSISAVRPSARPPVCPFVRSLRAQSGHETATSSMLFQTRWSDALRWWFQPNKGKRKEGQNAHENPLQFHETFVIFALVVFSLFAGSPNGTSKI